MPRRVLTATVSRTPAPADTPVMEAARRQQIHAIRSMSEQMLQLARNEAWETLADLEPERRRLIMRFFDKPASEEEAAAIAETIQDVLDIDREIIERGKQGRDAVRQQLSRLNQGQRAVDAYHEAGR